MIKPTYQTMTDKCLIGWGKPTYQTEYITIKTHAHLIGKRAKFKNNLAGYCSHLWDKKGVITQLFQVEKGDLDHIGLSLVFDKPAKRYDGDNMPMHSCYIEPDSIEVLE